MKEGERKLANTKNQPVAALRSRSHVLGRVLESGISGGCEKMNKFGGPSLCKRGKLLWKGEKNRKTVDLKDGMWYTFQSGKKGFFRKKLTNFFRK